MNPSMYFHRPDPLPLCVVCSSSLDFHPDHSAVNSIERGRGTYGVQQDLIIMVAGVLLGSFFSFSPFVFVLVFCLPFSALKLS